MLVLPDPRGFRDGCVHFSNALCHCIRALVSCTPTIRLKSGMALSRLLMSLAKGFFSPSVLSMLLCSWCNHQVCVFHQRVGDELGCNLLELVSDDQVCHSCFDDDLLRCVGLLTRLFIHLHQRAMTESSPCLGGRWELYGPRDAQTPLRPACFRENTGQLISRILRQMSCAQVHLRRVTVLPRFKAIDEFYPVNSKPANSCPPLQPR